MTYVQLLKTPVTPSVLRQELPVLSEFLTQQVLGPGRGKGGFQLPEFLDFMLFGQASLVSITETWDFLGQSTQVPYCFEATKALWQPGIAPMDGGLCISEQMWRRLLR